MKKFPLTTDELVDMIGAMSLALQDIYDTCQEVIDKYSQEIVDRYSGSWGHEDLTLAFNIQERIDKVEL